MRVAIIPARGGSKGVLKKNLRKVNGKTLVARAIIVASRTCETVIVTTDSKDIAEEAFANGALVVDRPENISGDEASSESAIGHVIETMELWEDQIAFIQCTSPFIDSGMLHEALNKLETKEADVLFSAIEDHGFIWEFKARQWGPKGHQKDERPRRQELAPSVRETGAFYVFSAAEFMKSGSRFHGKVKPVITNSLFSMEIDSEEDLKQAQLLAPIWTSQAPELSFSNIQIIFSDFDGVLTDNKVHMNQIGIESVTASRADGLAVKILSNKGVRVVVVSSEKNPVTVRRCQKMGVECISGVGDKGLSIKNYLRDADIRPEQALFLGNDVNDLSAGDEVGMLLAVRDANADFKLAASYLLQSRGGEGALRELADIIQSHQ